jgi:hypothetical protein
MNYFQDRTIVKDGPRSECPSSRIRDTESCDERDNETFFVDDKNNEYGDWPKPYII